MREFGRGKRWLLLRRWRDVRGKKRQALQELFTANRRLFKAYILREQLDHLWTYTTRPGVLRFVLGWMNALRWQRWPERKRLGDFLFRHLDGIAAYCDHHVRFGLVESLNTTIKAVLRRARGMKDEAMLVLKLKWATARPILYDTRSESLPSPGTRGISALNSAKTAISAESRSACEHGPAGDGLPQSGSPLAAPSHETPGSGSGATAHTTPLALRDEDHVILAVPSRVIQTPRGVHRDASCRVLGSRGRYSHRHSPGQVKLLLPPRQKGVSCR